MANGGNNNVPDVWTLRIEAVGKWLLGPVLTALGTVLANQYFITSQVQSKIDEAKKQITQVASAAATNAETAATSAKTAATSAKSLADEVEGVKLTQEQIALTSQANLKQWKAYNSKMPEDKEEAFELTRMAETLSPPMPASAAPPP